MAGPSLPTLPLKGSDLSLIHIWLFSDSVSGANASAVVYTMVEMAKAHDLNVYVYLKFLLDHRPTKEMTDVYKRQEYQMHRFYHLTME